MTEDNGKIILISNSLEKAERSLNSAKDSLERDDIDNALNRIYYSIFYSVMALGYN